MKISTHDLTNLRQEYSAKTLNESEVDINPFKQFEIWYDEASQSGIVEPNAFTLSTATPDGRPSARVVLLKTYGESGFTFFSNYNSRKGGELAANPYACFSFFWLELQRQVIIKGRIEKTSAEESTAYYQSRPKGSQIGAWASPQSEPVADRSVLEKSLQELMLQYADATVLPRPAHWGGFRLIPETMEFWQGRPNRLHDRIQYSLQTEGSWKIQRLAP